MEMPIYGGIVTRSTEYRLVVMHEDCDEALANTHSQRYAAALEKVGWKPAGTDLDWSISLDRFFDKATSKATVSVRKMGNSCEAAITVIE